MYERMYEIQMKPKSGEFAEEFLLMADLMVWITADFMKFKPCLLGLDCTIDQECNLKIGEQLLYSTKHRTALPVSAQISTGVEPLQLRRGMQGSPADMKNYEKPSSRMKTVPSSVAQKV